MTFMQSNRTNEEQVDENYFAARLEQMRSASEAFRGLWNQWATGQPQSIICERHNFERKLLIEESQRESWRQNNTVALYTPCPTCMSDAETVRVSRWLASAGVPDILLHASFENFKARTDEDRVNLDLAKKFAVQRRGFLAMLGPAGLGKTHLAVAIMREIGKGRLETQSQLLYKLRKTYRDNDAEDIIEACMNTPFFVLDEVGLSVGGKDELPMLHDILSERHNSRRPTVLTTNLPSKEELFAVLGERMADRFKQSGFKLLGFKGKSLREEYRQPYFDDNE